MNPILVNVDYENVLFGGPSLLARIHALEFIAFWVQDNPVVIHRQYSDFYLEHIKQSCSRTPKISSQDSGTPWWGELKDISLEKRLNSKIWARDWWGSRYKFQGKICFSELEVLELIQDNQWWLIKRNFGMSGQGNRKVKLDQWDKNKTVFQSWFSDGVIVEPLRNRTSDISALWLPNEEKYIYYRNQIDNHFQWRGVELENGGDLQLNEEEKLLLLTWSKDLNDLKDDIIGQGYKGPFSVDAFFYNSNDKLQFHPCSEINARKTMGWIAYNLWLRNKTPFSSLFLENKKINNSEWMLRLKKIDVGVTLISPEQSLFTWYWVEASSLTELQNKVAVIRNL